MVFHDDLPEDLKDKFQPVAVALKCQPSDHPGRRDLGFLTEPIVELR
jgi:hypothetical protein